MNCPALGADKAAGADAGTTGELYVIKPGATGCEILSQTSLEGKCFGSPVAYNGRVYLQTDKKLYCFGKAGNNPGLQVLEEERKRQQQQWPKPGPAKQLQIIPYEVLLKPGQTHAFRLRSLDANGFTVD